MNYWSKPVVSPSMFSTPTKKNSSSNGISSDSEQENNFLKLGDSPNGAFLFSSAFQPFQTQINHRRTPGARLEAADGSPLNIAGVRSSSAGDMQHDYYNFFGPTTGITSGILKPSPERGHVKFSPGFSSGQESASSSSFFPHDITNIFDHTSEEELGLDNLLRDADMITLKMDAISPEKSIKESILSFLIHQNSVMLGSKFLFSSTSPII